MTPAGSTPDGADTRAGVDPATRPGRAGRPAPGPAQGTVLDGDRPVTDADRIRSAVLDCPDVADLSVGAFGEVASYLPGRKVAGVRVDDDRVEVHIVAAYGRSLREVADEIGRRVAPLLGDRPLSVAVDDILLPGETLAADDAGAAVDTATDDSSDA